MKAEQAVRPDEHHPHQRLWQQRHDEAGQVEALGVSPRHGGNPPK